MADLYIRWSTANPKDIGDRPITPCWPPNAVWTNASIWMSYPYTHPDPAKRGLTAYAARLGEQVLINVAAFTRGATFQFPGDQVPVICQMWACNLTNGVGPVSGLPSTNGEPASTAPCSATWTRRTGSGVASALWTPDAADGLLFDADGAAHVCLAANLVYNGSAMGTPHAQGQYLPQFMSGGQPVRTIFPCGDGPIDPRSAVPIGHFQGQKNIQVWNTTTDPTMTLEVLVWGRGPGPEGRVPTLAERSGRKAIDAAIREHLLAHPFVDLAGGRERRARVSKLTPELREALEPVLDEELLRAGPLPLEPHERARLAGGGRLVLTDDRSTPLEPARRPLADVAIDGPNGERNATVEVEVGSARPERVIVDLGAARDDRRGTLRIFDLAERDAEGALVGGTTFVTVAA